SAGASSASLAPRNRSSHESSDSMRRLKASAERSSSRSSYWVSPRLDACVGESSYSSLRNVSTKEENDDIKLLLRSAERGPFPRLQDNGIEQSVSLTEYQRKRDFKRTPEPKGKPPKKAETRRYVVHRHHATRLHWDV